MLLVLTYNDDNTNLFVICSGVEIVEKNKQKENEATDLLAALVAFCKAFLQPCTESVGLFFPTLIFQ